MDGYGKQRQATHPACLKFPLPPSSMMVGHPFATLTLISSAPVLVLGCVGLHQQR
ncbi:hypothetical protein LY78DRAFT_657987 [Colletotrichum sublineola]|nr:hypothetical protein LY78DRAFT_657987 [Colletotrichum sublineola]